MSTIQIKVPNWLDKICAWPVMLYRKQKYGYSYRRIPLGESKYTIVDPQDFYRFNIFNWCPQQNGPDIYAVRLVSNPKKIVSLHREIMDFPKGLVVDHRNNNGLDNRRENLRAATQSQNSCNKAKTKLKTSSLYIGVHFDKRRGLWAASIRNNGKTIWLGRFESEIEAARAYDRAAIKYHGEFARLNFPREDYANEILSTND
jgi:hypothetical protein